VTPVTTELLAGIFYRIVAGFSAMETGNWYLGPLIDVEPGLCQQNYLPGALSGMSGINEKTDHRQFFV
jgi:hypothetical protein